MMKFWEDWKEKLKKFLKADVLAECRQQVIMRTESCSVS